MSTDIAVTCGCNACIIDGCFHFTRVGRIEGGGCARAHLWFGGLLLGVDRLVLVRVCLYRDVCVCACCPCDSAFRLDRADVAERKERARLAAVDAAKVRDEKPVVAIGSVSLFDVKRNKEAERTAVAAAATGGGRDGSGDVK